jgi:uncharacterized protein
VDVPEVPLSQIVALVRDCPTARFVLVNGDRYVGSPLGRKGSGLPANYLIEFSRMDSKPANEIGLLLANLGAGRLAFGTGMPFQYPNPALLKLEVLGVIPADKELISWRNAARWLPS